MAGLQRSAMSFRRQGSSGLVWDEKFLELNHQQEEEEEERDDNKDQQQQQQIKPSISVNVLDRTRSNGGRRAFLTDKVSPEAIEPQSPKLSACGFCSAFGKQNKTRRPPKSGERRTQ